LSRRDDLGHRDFSHERRDRPSPESRVMLAPGYVIVPGIPAALGAIVGGSVVVTLYAARIRRGGACHFAWPRPPRGVQPTALYGVAALRVLLGAFERLGSSLGELSAGVFGGAVPDAATSQQRANARGNVDLAFAVLDKKAIGMTVVDVGGHRGRKLWFMTATNEVAVVKTHAIRSSDWFPSSESEVHR
jgi:chemotaxis receptor (MCP) glutamine deamidase CheD